MGRARAAQFGGVHDLRTGGRWFDARLHKYFFLGLMMVSMTEFTSSLPVEHYFGDGFWETRQWIGKNIALVTGNNGSRKPWVGALAAAI